MIRTPLCVIHAYPNFLSRDRETESLSDARPSTRVREGGKNKTLVSFHGTSIRYNAICVTTPKCQDISADSWDWFPSFGPLWIGQAAEADDHDRSLPAENMLFCAILSLAGFVPGSATCSSSSGAAARVPEGFCCWQPCLGLHCTIPAAFLCISLPAEHSRTRSDGRWQGGFLLVTGHWATGPVSMDSCGVTCFPLQGEVRELQPPWPPYKQPPPPVLSQCDSWTKWRLFLIYSCNLQWIILGWFINMKHIILSVCHRWKN